MRDLGFAVSGSVIERYSTVRASSTPASFAGKTLSHRLSPDQAERYREWIANRRLDDLLQQTDQLSRPAADLITTGPTGTITH